MTNTKSTKRALLVSVMAMVICFTMLLGTTFAWFTDSETSRNNIIKSGNLDVTFQYSADGSAWSDLTNSTKVFAEENALWEPGYVEVVYLKVGNVGTLDLNYRLGVKIVSESQGTNADGNFMLSDFIKYAVIPYTTTPVYADSTAAIAAAEAHASAKLLKAEHNEKHDIEAGAGEQCYVLIVYMPTTVGNAANYKTGSTAPELKLGLNVTATQKASESDHYNNQYDAAGSDPADPNA